MRGRWTPSQPRGTSGARGGGRGGGGGGHHPAGGRRVGRPGKVTEEQGVTQGETPRGGGGTGNPDVPHTHTHTDTANGRRGSKRGRVVTRGAGRDRGAGTRNGRYMYSMYVLYEHRCGCSRNMCTRSGDNPVKCGGAAEYNWTGRHSQSFVESACARIASPTGSYGTQPRGGEPSGSRSVQCAAWRHYFRRSRNWAGTVPHGHGLLYHLLSPRMRVLGQRGPWPAVDPPAWTRHDVDTVAFGTRARAAAVAGAGSTAIAAGPRGRGPRALPAATTALQ